VGLDAMQTQKGRVGGRRLSSRGLDVPLKVLYVGRVRYHRAQDAIFSLPSTKTGFPLAVLPRGTSYRKHSNYLLLRVRRHCYTGIQQVDVAWRAFGDGNGDCLLAVAERS
jgi:hypothetical protein